VKTKQLLLAGLGGGQVLAYLFLLSLENLRGAILLCQVAFFFAFFLYLASLYLLNPFHPQPHKMMEDKQREITFSDKKVVFTLIVIFALFFRIILWLSPPTLSDDIYRYLWEGRLVSMDINPFEYAPDAPQLEHMRDIEVFTQINHKNFVTIYPPLTQFIFSLSLQLHPSIKMMNLTFLIFDVLTMVGPHPDHYLCMESPYHHGVCRKWTPRQCSNLLSSTFLLSLYKRKKFFIHFFPSTFISWKIAGTHLPPFYSAQQKGS